MLYWSAILEVFFSAVLTVFLSEPMFTFDIYSCGVSGLSDWYSYLFNPSPRYEKVMICTQERVYPLQTMVLVFYVFCVTFMLVLRPIINEKVKPTIANPSLAIYHSLYAFPLLALIHSLFGGLVYFAFPYLSIIISCGANAGHFAMKLDQTTKSLLITSVTDLRNIIIIGKDIRKDFTNNILIYVFDSWKLAALLIWNNLYQEILLAVPYADPLNLLHCNFEIHKSRNLLRQL